ncbi:MAG: VOC family protein [Synergistaceae bacterium]|jgi:predicted enzyme related to lactoylglutathione lyase|nr:VOC family protein [Synergistaceae bacterium]
MVDGIYIGDISIDCGDPEGLRGFYAELLGWDRRMMYGCPAVVSKGGFVILFMETDCVYCPPIWPETPGAQQKQMHFNFAVSDLPAAVEAAVRLGARRAAAQYGGGQYVTLLDPAGHPFCLCQSNAAGQYQNKD